MFCRQPLRSQPRHGRFGASIQQSLAERSRQGLCFIFDEIYVWGHRCTRLFYNLQLADKLFFKEERGVMWTSPSNMESYPLIRVLVDEATLLGKIPVTLEIVLEFEYIYRLVGRVLSTI